MDVVVVVDVDAGGIFVRLDWTLREFFFSDEGRSEAVDSLRVEFLAIYLVYVTDEVVVSGGPWSRWMTRGG